MDIHEEFKIERLKNLSKGQDRILTKINQICKEEAGINDIEEFLKMNRKTRRELLELLN